MIRAKNFKNQKGAVLLFGVLITSIILTVSLGISILVISKIKQTKNANNSIIAYYIAECGAENGLYKVRKEGVNINNINANDMANGGQWVRTGSDKSNQISVPLIKNNESIYINLYDPNAVNTEGAPDYHASIEAFSIECRDDGTSSGVIINADEWDLSASNLTSAYPGSIFIFCAGLGVPTSKTFVLADKAYRIKIQASVADVHNLIFKAYEDNALATQAPIIDKKIIKSTGNYIGAMSGVQTETPTEPPW